MGKLIRKVTLGVSLLGIGIGAGGVLLNPTPAVTTEKDEHIDEDRNCLTGCETGVEICCSADETE